MLWAFTLFGFFLRVKLWVTSYAILEHGTIGEIAAFLTRLSKLDRPTSALWMLEVLGIAHWEVKLRRLVCEEREAALECTCRESSDGIVETVWRKIAS